MSAWEDAKGTVQLRSAIQIKAYCHHRLEHLQRRTNMRNATLGGPGVEPFRLAPSPHGNRHVLMPWDEPVGGRSLVEERCLRRERPPTQNVIDDATDGVGSGGSAYGFPSRRPTRPGSPSKRASTSCRKSSGNRLETIPNPIRSTESMCWVVMRMVWLRPCPSFTVPSRNEFPSAGALLPTRKDQHPDSALTRMASLREAIKRCM